jgi:predicted membrane protein
MRIPVVEVEIERPTRASLAWYAGIGAMAVAGVVEWPVAAVVATGHLIAENSRSPAVAGAVEGADSAAG